MAIFWRRHFGRNRVSAVSQREPLSFVVFRLDSLGDLILTTPLFRALKASYPQSHCAVVVQSSYKSLLVTNPHVDAIITLPSIESRWLPQGARRLLAAVFVYWARLRNRRFDFAIAPRWDTDEHLATFLCVLTNAAKRIGYSSETSAAKRTRNAGFDAAFDICLPDGPVCHEVLRNLAVADSVGASGDDDRLEIQITDRDRRRAAGLLKSTPAGARVIALGIGAHSPGRRWPLSRYAKTINQLEAQNNIQSVIVCASAELGDALKLDSRLATPAIIVSGARLREVCAVLERCDLFIGNDSGCAHLAAAMGCKTLVISRHPSNGDPNHFNSPVRFSPYGTHVRVLQPAIGRDNCEEACVVHAPHCIRSVTVEETVSAALQMVGPPVAATPTERRMPHTSKGSRLTLSGDVARSAVDTALAGIQRPEL